jgi:hypothetical protein
LTGRDQKRESHPDWNEPVEIEETGFRSRALVTAILLGGVFIGLIVAMWYLVK